MNRTFLVVISLFVAFGVSACNDNDGGDGGPNGNGDDLHGVFFTETNAEVLASKAAAALNIFPGVNGAYVVIIHAVENHGFFEGEPMPADGYDLGDLGLCSSGQAVAKWKDVDDSKTLTAGDTVALDLTDCDARSAGAWTSPSPRSPSPSPRPASPST